MRILSVTYSSYLDDRQAAAAACRILTETLKRRGFATEVLSSTGFGLDREADLAVWLRGQGLAFEEFVSAARDLEMPGAPAELPTHCRLIVRDIPVTLYRGPATRVQNPDDGERAEFLRLFDAVAARFRPEVVLTCSNSVLFRDVLARAKTAAIPGVVLLRDSNCRDPSQFDDAAAVLVPSQLLADYYRGAFGLACAVLPELVDHGRVRAERHDPGYVTFVDPSLENGVYAFSRIADELGRRRPHIPLLVVEGRGTEATLAACGLDLRAHGNVNLMPPTPNSRLFWDATRICLVPSLAWDNHPAAAVEAIVNGIPVIGSDRGGLPNTLGGAGVVLPLPDRITQATRMLPMAEEVTPWIEAILRLWDDADLCAEQRRRALHEARRWAPEVLEPEYLQFFSSLSFRRIAAGRPLPNKSQKCVPGLLEDGVPGEARGAVCEDDVIAVRLNSLSRAFPWPEAKPEVELPVESRGWLGEGSDTLLGRELSDATRLVVELGAWRGMSTRFIADHAANAAVVSVDHWQGSPEHRTQAEFQGVLSTLYESFLAECWAYRDRVIPLRMTTLAGLRTVADHGLEPDLIYVDAEHSYASVTAELELSRQLFPHASLVGDDYDWRSVRRAVDDFARRHGLAAVSVGRRGWKLVDQARSGAFLLNHPQGRSNAIVLVPYLHGIEWECELGLQQLERSGVRVVRAGGSSQIDIARNVLASDALHDGAESLLFIDADIGFDPLDALRLLARPESVVAGLYARKGHRSLASVLAEGITELVFGQDAQGLYPLKYAATGFLRIRAEVLRRLVEGLQLPLCNTNWSRGIWPFFQPLIVKDGEQPRYLGEDWAFSHKLHQIGVTPMADASIRLWHYGRYGYGWEDAGADPIRYPSFIYRAESPREVPSPSRSVRSTPP